MTLNGIFPYIYTERQTHTDIQTHEYLYFKDNFLCTINYFDQRDPPLNPPFVCRIFLLKMRVQFK